MSSEPNSPSNGSKKDTTLRRSASENSAPAIDQSFGDNPPPASPTAETKSTTPPPAAETAQQQTTDIGTELSTPSRVPTSIEPPAYLINTPTLYGSNTAVPRDELDPVEGRFLGPNGHSPASLRQLAKERRLARGAAGPSAQAGVSAARYVGRRVVLRDVHSVVSNNGDGPSAWQKKDDAGVEDRKEGINEDQQKKRRSSKEQEGKPAGKGKEREHESS